MSDVGQPTEGQAVQPVPTPFSISYDGGTAPDGTKVGRLIIHTVVGQTVVWMDEQMGLWLRDNLTKHWGGLHIVKELPGANGRFTPPKERG